MLILAKKKASIKLLASIKSLEWLISELCITD